MTLSATLSIYFGRQYLLGVALVFLVLVLLAFTFDTVELLRRAAGRPETSFGLVLEMSLLKLPALSQKLMPFAALFGAMLTLSRLTRSHELTVARAAGVSVWQFLAPALLLTMAIGTIVVALYNPLASALVARYEQLEAKHLRGRTSSLAVSSTGLWLREADADGQVVVHALRVAQQGIELNDAIFLFYDPQGRFVRRIDASAARLVLGNSGSRWEMDNALLTGPDQPAARLARHTVPTTLTLSQIQNSFASPETMSFWSLPAFIATLENAGFSALRHRLHWYATMAVPFLLCAMVLVAASFSLRLTRRGGTGLMLVGGVAAGFLLYFLSDLIMALGLTGAVPAPLAAWAPAGVSALLGLAMLFRLEDG
jgi:lipopolysaccharide export system permease protein